MMAESVIQDIEDFLLSRGYENPAIIPVSSVTGEGVEDIRSGLYSSLVNTSEREDFDRPRLFVDRVFHFLDLYYCDRYSYRWYIPYRAEGTGNA